MSIYSYFFNAKQVEGEYDRTYTAEDITSYLDGIVGSGVFPVPSDCLQVYAGSGMKVLVKPGMGWIDGHKIVNTADLELEIDPADVTLSRIDRVVFRANNLTRDMEIVVKKGANSSNPVAPDIVRDQDITEYSLATVTVSRNVTAITDAVIRDTRPDSTVCGFVQGLIQQVGTDTLYKQWTAAFDKQYEEYTEEFEAWFEEMRENLKDVVMWQEYKNAIVTTDDNVKTVNIGIPQYNADLDVLSVYVNGMRLDSTEYTATATQVTFTKPLDVVGTSIEFVVYKSVNADEATTVAEEVQDHENRITKLEELTHIYECTGTDDNKKLSQIAQDFLLRKGEYANGSYTAHMVVKVVGDVGMSDPVLGTDSGEYIHFILGKYNNPETGEDSTESKRKITFDFTECGQIYTRLIGEQYREKTEIAIAGDEVDIIGMNINLAGMPKKKVGIEGKKPRLRDCEVSLQGGTEANGAMHGGTFEGCIIYAMGSSDNVIALASDGTDPLKAIDCYIIAYTYDSGSGAKAIGIYAPSGNEESVVIAERCNIPDPKDYVSGDMNQEIHHSIKIDSGYCSLVSNIIWKAAEKYTVDISKCSEAGTMLLSKPM